MAPQVKGIVTYPPESGSGSAWKMEDLKLRDPEDNELEVRLVASGICHTDIVISSLPLGMGRHPIVLGHEGSGYVTKIGPKVSVAKVGDPVALSFTSCSSCRLCKTGHPAYCSSFNALNLGGDPGCFEGRDGKITGKFFGQSSFASYSLVAEDSVINLSGVVKDDEELKLFSPLGCGLQTGSGTIANLAGAGPEDTVTVIGLGGVGLAGVMAAKLLGCRTIIGVDRIESRLELAKSIGATHVFNTHDSGLDIVKEVLGATNGEGTTITMDTTGVAKLLEKGVEYTARWGKILLVGVSSLDGVLPIHINTMIANGKMLWGSIEGDVIPSEYIPRMINWYREGKFPLDKLIKYYPAEKFEEALHDMHTGVTVKPILVW